MKKISFVINTAINEKLYLFALINSIIENTNFKNHEIVIFIDSDNENTYTELKEKYTNVYENIKIINNDSGTPIGYQRNISILFDQAKNDLVCYLQSDMVVCPEFDSLILREMGDRNDMIVCCGRVEPPLHPADADKIHKNLGLHPDNFDKKQFNEFCKSVLQSNKQTVNGFFAPFCTTKDVFLNCLGGFDPQFRNSREDSDFIIKLNSNKYITSVISWKAIVYHYTCVSSRGINWFNVNDISAVNKNELQIMADYEELKKFIRKWGFFGHHYKPRTKKVLKIEIDKPILLNDIEPIEPYFDIIHIENENYRYIFDFLNSSSFSHNNLRLKYSFNHWDKVKDKYNFFDVSKKFLSNPFDLYSFNSYNVFRVKSSNLSILKEVLSFINDIDYNIINEYSVGDVFDIYDEKITIEINTKEDINQKNLTLDYKKFI